MTIESCAEHSGVCQNIKAISDELKDLSKDNRESHKEMWSAINGLRNRLPPWAVALISLMTGAIGWLVK